MIDATTKEAIEALISALERTENNLRLSIRNRPVRDLAENDAENAHAVKLALRVLREESSTVANG